tara:strand:+ start:949 stop:1470 length:522 start_codon:yes stop_codon:yes gene_type:complete
LDENVKEFYIGSTDNFKRRVKEHKSRYNCGYTYNIYKFIRENGGISNWEINYIQKFKFLTKPELKEYEQWYIDTYKPELNTQNAVRPKNYRDKYKEYFKEKYNENREEILKKNKEYRIKNPEKVKKQQKEYREKNKEKLKEKYNEKINCPQCNKILNTSSLKRHIKSKHPTSI